MHTDPWTNATVVGDRRPSMAVIDLVASLEGVDPLDLEPLYDSIDPDVLDSICCQEGFSELEFDYCNRSITVEATDDGLEITVEAVAPPIESETGLADSGPSV